MFIIYYNCYIQPSYWDCLDYQSVVDGFIKIKSFILAKINL